MKLLLELSSKEKAASVGKSIRNANEVTLDGKAIAEKKCILASSNVDFWPINGS